MGDARAVLLTLIEENLLSPGAKKLYVSYYRKRVYADLLVDGSIRFKDVVYTSPVPCALQMKRTLNPSLKTDAGWSSMFSAASGESLKDIKDRLNIRKRGPNSRTLSKDKKVAVAAASSAPTSTASATTSKDRLVSAAVEISRLAVILHCPVCQKDATSDYVVCSACQSKTHLKCALPPLENAPLTSWFCEKCVASQATRILEFLQQTKRVLVDSIDAQKNVTTVDDSGETVDEKEQSHFASTQDPSLNDIGGASEEVSSPHAVNENDKTVDSVEETSGDNTTKNPEKIDSIEDGEHGKTLLDDSADANLETDISDADSTSNSDVTKTKDDQSSHLRPVLSSEEKFRGLVDALIAEVSDRQERVDLIANSTGATLVHLAKTQLVQLVENGKRDIEDVMRVNDEQDSIMLPPAVIPAPTAGSSEVDALIKIFDLRHQIVASQAQFERTTNALAKHTEKRVRAAETELMQIEESRVTEAAAVNKIVDLIAHYTKDLDKCQKKIHIDQLLLQSMLHRRNFIRTSTMNDAFVPGYRLVTKQMSTSSDQLLRTILLDKLLSIARSVNEWAKMEAHFETTAAGLKESLTFIGTKRTYDQTNGATTPSALPLFGKVKIPPSRRLIERQLNNYEMNLKTIRSKRAGMKKILSGMLKIVKEEHLCAEIIETTELLFQKCGSLKEESVQENTEEGNDSEAEEDDMIDEDDRNDAEGETVERQQEMNAEPPSKKARTNELFEASDNVGSQEIDGTEPSPRSPIKSDTVILGISPASANQPSATILNEVTGDIDESIQSMVKLERVESASKSGSNNMFSMAVASHSASSVTTMQQEHHIVMSAGAVLPKRADNLQELPQVPGVSAFNRLGDMTRTDQPSPVSASVAGNHQLQMKGTHKPDPPYVPEPHGNQIQQKQQDNTDKYSIASTLQRNQQTEQRRQQQEQEQQAFLDQALEVLKQQPHQRKQTTHIPAQKTAPQQSIPHHQPQQQQQTISLLQQQQQHQASHQQLHASQPFQRMPQSLGVTRKEPSQQSSTPQQSQASPQLPSQLHQAHHAAAATHHQLLSHSHQQLPSHHQVPLHLQAQQQQQQQQQHQQQQQQQQTMQQHQTQQQHSTQPSRQIQHPLYGDVQKTLAMSSGLSGNQDLYVDHAQQSHMGMDLHQQHQHLHHPSHLSAGDVMRQHHDLTGGNSATGASINSHFANPAVGGSLSSSSSLRTPTFLSTNEPRGTQQRSFYGEDAQQQQQQQHAHGHSVLHSHDVFGSHNLQGHHPHHQQTQQQQHHHQLYATDLSQQQQHSRPVVGQDYHMMGRHFRDPNTNQMNHPGMDPSGSDNVDMSEWN